MKNYHVAIYFFLFVFIGSACKTHNQRPNVLFIAVDDLRTELGCYGKPTIQTPNLDKLASEGAIFLNHFVQVPTCGASRFCLLTGNRPIKRSQLSNDVIVKEISGKSANHMPETFIHQLRRNGYYTVGIGKISHSADGLVYGYSDEPTDVKELPYSWDELIFDHGKWGTGWNAFFGYADGENRQSMKRQVKPYESAEVGDEGYVDGLTAQLAITKLRELKDSTFFLGVGFFKPHLPFNAPKQYWDLYKEDNINLSSIPLIPDNVNIKSLHESGELNGYQLTDEVAGLSQPLSVPYSKKLRHAYFASISYVDAQIGKVLSELQKLGLEENTIVIVWGDHGWHLGDQQVWGKHTLFDNALKSTLIFKVPGLGSGHNQVKSIVETVDLYPTILELCQVEMAYQTDGESFVNLLKTPASQKSDVAYSYFRNGISLRTDRYRLTRYFRTEEPTIELYDHKQDPHETINVASVKPEIVHELMPLLEMGNTGLYEPGNGNLE